MRNKLIELKEELLKICKENEIKIQRISDSIQNEIFFRTDKSNEEKKEEIKVLGEENLRKCRENALLWKCITAIDEDIKKGTRTYEFILLKYKIMNRTNRLNDLIKKQSNTSIFKRKKLDSQIESVSDELSELTKKLK